MNIKDAEIKIRNSVSNGAQLITPKGKTYEDHLEEIVNKLMDHLIEPLEVIIISACFPEYDYEKYKNSKVWAIACMRDSWLLTLDDENEFALGFGKTEKSIMMHGFSSSDAIGEWCA